MLQLLFFFIQAHSQEIAQGSQYLSPEDVASTIKTLSVSNAYDNASGIYSGPLNSKLQSIVDNDHRFNLVKVMTQLTPDQLNDDPKAVKSLLSNSKSDALLTFKVIRTPTGMELGLRLYRANDGLLFLEVSEKEVAKYSVRALEGEVESLYKKLIDRFPYQGLVLSRKGRDVTLNIGGINGLEEGDEISAVQIVGYSRHPKFQFVINSKKELLGTLRVVKADKRLSFAKIISERAPGAIGLNTKIETKKFVKYGDIEGTLREIPGLFGRESKEWVPERAPSFGRVMAGFGLGRYSGALNGTFDDSGTTVSKNISSISSFVPAINLEAEIWMNPQWMITAGLGQSIINTETEAGKQNASTTKWSFDFGYNMLFSDNFFGPKLGFSLGFLSYSFSIDESGSDGLTSLWFRGWGLGVGGSFPVSKKSDKWTVGGKFTTYFNSSMKETQRTSGTSVGVRINYFDIHVGYKVSERIRLKTMLSFELYSSKFRDSGTRAVTLSDGTASPIMGDSASNRFTTLSLNVNYLF